MNLRHKIILSAIIGGAISIVMTPCIAHQYNSTHVSRYITVENKPKQAQIDLLSQTVQVRFPQKIHTIQEAMEYLLNFSGYSLAANTDRSPELKITLGKPLPLINRELGAMPLKTALIVLAGSAFELMQDPINREVNFRLKAKFKKHSKINQKRASS